jgi:nucleoside-diphosphate-sugar epimerase
MIGNGRPSGTRRVALVTGCAGFLASHLCERLVADGWTVRGADCFTPFYGRDVKERNLAGLRAQPAFELREVDLAADSLAGIADGVDAVFHLAGEPGARQSFGPGVGPAVRNNLEGTARLLGESLAARPGVFVFASSSTIYGNPTAFPTAETTAPDPLSPYGRTKVAAERLVGRFAQAGLATVILRYFSCYGPRQRPDMAIARFIEAIRTGRAVTVNGDGSQRRDFTFVADAVDATVLAAERAAPGSAYNVGGGESVALRDALTAVGDLMGSEPRIELAPAAPGDAHETRADVTAAARDLGFRARTAFSQGLAAQVAASEPSLAAAGGPG